MTFIGDFFVSHDPPTAFVRIMSALASIFVILAGAVYLGAMPSSHLDNLTPGELGVFGVLFIVIVAMVSYWEHN